MPAIILFGRGWLFSSDDFVFSSLFIILVRLAGLLVVGVSFGLYCNDSLKCLPRVILELTYLAFAIAIFQILIRCALALASSSGGIADVQRRVHVAKIFYVHLIFMLFELVLYSLLLYLEISSTRCHNIVCVVVRVVCIFGIILIVSNFISFLASYDSTGRAWKDTPGLWCMELKNEGTTVNRATAHYLNAQLWNRRIRCLACLRSCCNSEGNSKSNDQNAMLLVSDIVGHYFMTNLVTSDLFAGLILLRWQTHQWVGCGHKVPLIRILEDTEPYNPVMSGTPHSPGSANAVFAAPITSQPDASQIKASSAFTKLAVEWLSIRRIYHYSKFANAVYGRYLYLFAHRLSPKAVCALCNHLECKGCCCKKRSVTGDIGHLHDHETDPMLNSSDGACSSANDVEAGCCICDHGTCNYAVFREITGMPAANLIHYSFINQVYRSPFMVAIDDEMESIVIAVRGTLSPEDMIVDMLAEGKRVPDEFMPLEASEFLVHMGMLMTATNLYNCITEMELIRKARHLKLNYPLVVCGHSLGAGVASILAFLLRRDYPEVKCYAYSPPLGLMNTRMARYCKPFVCSIIYGYDLVPRLSIPTLNDLKWRLLDALMKCKVPKFKLLSRGAKLISFRCLMPCFSWPRIGLDTRLIDSSLQRHLLFPVVPQARFSAYSTSSDFSERRLIGDFKSSTSTPTPSLQEEPRAYPMSVEVTNADYLRSLISSHSESRFIPGPRSLIQWVRNSGSLLLKTAAPGTAFGTFYTSPAGMLVQRQSENSATDSSRQQTESQDTHDDIVSMDTNVRFAGLTLHIVEVDDSAYSSSISDLNSLSSPWLPFIDTPTTRRPNSHRVLPPVAVWSSARQFQSILIHPRMMRDHLPNEIMGALGRLHLATQAIETTSSSLDTREDSSIMTPENIVRRLKQI